jgi:hypothetical protein
MNLVKYDSEAAAESREKFLQLIPEPDAVFIAAAKRAVINAGFSDEILEILHPATPESRTE